MNLSRTFLALFLSTSLAAVASAKNEWNYPFDSLKTGDLIGQDNWKGYTPAPDVTELSPQLVKSTEGNHGLVLAQNAFEGKASSRARKDILPLYDGKPSTDLVLEFDARATAANSIAVMGFGGGAAFPATVGIQFDQFVVREENFNGTSYPAIDSSGKRLTPKRGDWYRIRSVWSKDPGTDEWTAGLAIRNLSAGEKSFTTLYFDRGQKAPAMPLKIDVKRPANQFRTVVIRLGIPGGEIDNLSISPQAN
ncbi:MAG: hypothetical protein WC205_06660 [Opitutaceae bacterium]|jgi:hypothetical protein